VIHDDGLGLPFLRPGNCVRRLVGVSQLNPSASDTREDTRPTNPVVCLPETQVVNEMQHSGSCQSRNVALAGIYLATLETGVPRLTSAATIGSRSHPTLLKRAEALDLVQLRYRVVI
jgi:hypothetical protein